MARYLKDGGEKIYNIARTWRQKCLVEGKSLLWSDSSIWSKESLTDFKRCFTDNPDESSDSFMTKFQKQLSNENITVIKLACELLFVYYLFTAIKFETKIDRIKTVASWKDLKIDDNKDVIKCLEGKIGNAGVAYNTHQPDEITFLAEFALKLAEKPLKERKEVILNDIRLRDFLNAIQEERKPLGYDRPRIANLQSKHIILHLLFPDKYERIASGGNKQLIVDTFSDILSIASSSDNLDDRILIVRKKLEELYPETDIDFYNPNPPLTLRQLWKSKDSKQIQALRIAASKQRKKISHSFKPEFSGTRKSYSIDGEIESRADHGPVTRALHDKLVEYGFDPKNNQARDLYLLSPKGRVTHLFEVKTDVSTTSIYKAVGQLMLHGAVERKTPKRIMVLPEIPKLLTRKALYRLGISVLNYKWKKESPVFEGLKKIL